MSEEHDSEGNSPAAWSAVVLLLVGITVITVGLYIYSEITMWIGGAILLIGLPVGWILAKAGYGVNGPKYKPSSHEG